jgi:hypothetical protein
MKLNFSVLLINGIGVICGIYYTYSFYRFSLQKDKVTLPC